MNSILYNLPRSKSFNDFQLLKDSNYLDKKSKLDELTDQVRKDYEVEI